MIPRRLALKLDSLAGSPRQAIEQAAALGLQGIEINVARGELAPSELDRQARKHLLHFLDDHDLEVAALSADTGFRFEDESRTELFLEQTRAILDLAVDLGVSRVTATTGPLAEKENGRLFQLQSEILGEIGNDAANRGACLALSAGLEAPGVMKAFLEAADNDGLRVNLDPANMVFNAHDPCEAISTLAEFIVAVRARDGRRYLDGSAEELSLGEGDVPYDYVIDALDRIEYEGFFTIARFPQPDPEEEIRKAIQFLKRYD